MSLFAPADPGPTQQAAAMAAMLQTQLAGQAQQSLGTGYQSGLDFLNTGYGAAKGDINANFDPALAAITSGYGTARGDVTSNYQNAYDKLSGASAGYQPYVQSGNAANTTLVNALGLGGAGGNADARNAFTASPQYQWNLDQATGNAVRGANRYGMATGGNTLDAITRLGSSLAGGEWNNWINNLTGMANRGLTGVAGQGGLASTSAGLSANEGNNLGNLATGQGANVGNAYANRGSALSALDVGQGTGSAGLAQWLGQGTAGIQTGLGTQLGQAVKTAADAQTQADTANKNWQLGLLGLGAKGLGIAAGPFTGGGGLGLSGLFGGTQLASGALGLPGPGFDSTGWSDLRYS
jgi:hypothetical protein